jgi:hypothetical protein
MPDNPLRQSQLSLHFGDHSRLSKSTLKYVAQRPHICNSCSISNVKCDSTQASFTSCRKMESWCSSEDSEVPQETNNHSLFGWRTAKRLVRNIAAGFEHEMGENCLAWRIIIASRTFRGLAKTSRVAHLRVELNPAINPGP